MRTELTVQDYLKGITDRNMSILARAITLVESKKAAHIHMATELMEAILPLTGKAKRIGVSGTPGVGKSTFLECYAMELIKNNKKVAVLAIDPTSQVTGGSILGDKTRMTELSQHKDAFIRPSPNGSTLGGVAAKTREAMLLCDAFGFDYIFIETVGVGQSEISVGRMVDFFLPLMQPGSGDDLQGIKRGILEVSDLVVVTKADGKLKEVAKRAQHDFTKSVDVLHHSKEWKVRVLTCSSLEKKGFNEIDKAISNFFANYFKIEKRSEQLKYWVLDLLIDNVRSKFKISQNVEKYITDIENGKLSVPLALAKINKDINRD